MGSRSDQSNIFQIIIPAFNEQSILDITLGKAKDHGYLKNLVVVNDASTDATRDVLDKWSREESLRVLHLSKNKRKEGAINELMKSLQASGELKPYTLLLDADTYLRPISPTKTLHSQIEEAISQIASGRYAALAFSLNAVYLKAPSAYWMSAFTTYVGMQFDNWLMSKEARLWVINGAAGLFKSSDLLALFEHMEFNFETGDLQITVDLMKQKKPIALYKDIVADSYVPSTLMKFFNQRRRWERGTTKVLVQDWQFYGGTFLPPSIMCLYFIVHLSIYLGLWIALIAAAMDRYNWNWSLQVFVGCFVGWSTLSLVKGLWVLRKERYRKLLLYFLSELVNWPVTFFIVVPARLFGGAEGLCYLAKKWFANPKSVR